MLFARIKISGKVIYISFSERYKADFKNAGIGFYSIKSESDFIRVSLDIFSPLSNTIEKLPTIFNRILVNLFSIESFGCCDKYVACSDAKKCLHDDLAYATACMYRKNLEAGRIFYGVNKNI